MIAFISLKIDRCLTKFFFRFYPLTEEITFFTFEWEEGSFDLFSYSLTNDFLEVFSLTVNNKTF